MRVREALPLLLLMPVIGFIGYAVMDQRQRADDERAAEMASRPIVQDSAPAATAPAAPPVVESGGSAEPPPPPSTAASGRTEILRAINTAGSTTYLNEVIVERDSGLARWPERIEQPLRIWVQDGKALPGWNPAYPDEVRKAFDTWTLTGIPVKFTFVKDSADGDVIVQWVDKFDAPITGRTLWARDRGWWIVNGSITLALHHEKGEVLDQDAIHAIALHEVGHLLGLDHCADTANIMTPKVRVRDLSEMDRNTIKLLYSLPAGSLKGG